MLPFGGANKPEDTPTLYPFIMRGKNLDIYVVKVKLNFEKQQEILLNILGKLITKGIDVLHVIRGPVEARGKSVTYFLVVNMTKAAISVESLLYELKKVNGVKDVSVGSERLGDKVIYPNAFPIYTYDRAVVLSADFLRAFFNTFYSYFKQPLLAASILYQIGIRVGYALAKEVHESTGRKDSMLIEDTLDLLKSMGFASFEYKVSKLKHGEITIKAEKSIEAEVVNIKGVRCHFLRGILSGILSFVEGEYVQVQETKCVGKGDSYCLFVASKESK